MATKHYTSTPWRGDSKYHGRVILTPLTTFDNFHDLKIIKNSNAHTNCIQTNVLKQQETNITGQKNMDIKQNYQYIQNNENLLIYAKRDADKKAMNI